ncbi:MAG TPA: hypothetical protein VF996_03350 [Candidatus Saccharimonadales bacterium]
MATVSSEREVGHSNPALNGIILTTSGQRQGVKFAEGISADTANGVVTADYNSEEEST